MTEHSELKALADIAEEWEEDHDEGAFERAIQAAFDLGKSSRPQAAIADDVVIGKMNPVECVKAALERHFDTENSTVLLDEERQEIAETVVTALASLPTHADGMEEAAVIADKARELVSDLHYASGCSCCRDDEAWETALNALGELLKAPKYSDGSGHDWDAVREEYEAIRTAAQDKRDDQD